MLKITYCRSDFESCSRKQLKDKEESVPENMWPNGKMG